MAVNAEDIGTELVPPRSPSDTEITQWSRWIEDVLLLIELRARSLDKALADIDGRVLDFVVRQVVAAHVRNPDGATQATSTIAVDDASSTQTRSFATRGGLSHVSIPEEFWLMLGLVGGGNGAPFAIDTAPRLGMTNHSPICALVFGALYCSCGTDIALEEGPLYEIGPADAWR